MKNYLNKNNEDISEIQDSNINYNSNSSGDGVGISNYLSDSNDNNIESEIEKDLKKFAKTFSKESKNKCNEKSLIKAVNSSNKYSQVKNLKIVEEEKRDLLDDYIIKLKNLGYPEIGQLFLSQDIKEREKTFKFFEYIIIKEANNYQSNDIYKKKYEKLEYQLFNIKQELNREIKSSSNIQRDLEYKIQKQKDYYDNKITALTKDNLHLKNLVNSLTFDKKELEQKLLGLNETISKFESMKSTIINAFEAIDYVQTSDMAKMLSRVKGAEKLIETLKGGYNDSLKELFLEISTLKNFIYDLHTEISLLLDNPSNIDQDIHNIPFLESINHIKGVFKENINQLKKKIGYSPRHSHDDYSSDNCFEKLNKFICSDQNKKKSNKNKYINDNE